MWDCIIIGANIPGLALGAMLARNGKRVVVMERKGMPGGRAVAWERGGYASLTGIQRIRYGKHGALTRICKTLGMDVTLTTIDTLSLLDLDGKTTRIPLSYTECITTEFFSFFDRIRAIKVLRRIKNTPSLEELDEVSLEEWFVRNKLGDTLQQFFLLLACEASNCTAVEKISSGEFLASLQKVLRTGCYLAYPRWGWGPIIQVFQREILKRGEIRWNTPVTGINVSHGAATGIQTDTDFIDGRCVVSAVPCQQLFNILSPEVTHQEFVRLCRDGKPSAGIIMDFALTHRVTKDRGFWFFLDPLSYGVFISNICHRHAPPGKQLATFICPCSVEEAKQPDTTRAFEAKVEENLKRAFIDFDRMIEWKRFRVAPMLDSVEMNISQTDKDRPGYRVPGVEGLFLVGDFTCTRGASGEVEYESVLGCYEKIMETAAHTA